VGPALDGSAIKELPPAVGLFSLRRQKQTFRKRIFVMAITVDPQAGG
jgi:hypothetical protein